MRNPAFTPPIASAPAAPSPNNRALMVGNAIAIGQMTGGLGIHRWLSQHGKDAGFLATGQVGITITARGIPHDAIKLDHACCAAVKTLPEAVVDDPALT